MYESKIRDARWIAYDLPGNAGWIAFLAGLILCAVKRPEITGNNAISAFLILNLLCAFDIFHSCCGANCFPIQ